MPIKRLSASLRLATATAAVKSIFRVVSFNGFRFGSLGEIPGATGISSAHPRVERFETLIGQSFDWRGLDLTAPTLSKCGPVQSSVDRGTEFSLDWTTPGNTESYLGSLPQTDVVYSLAQADIPTTIGHGAIGDSASYSAAGINGLNQKVTPGVGPYIGGSGLNGRTFIFTVHVALPDGVPRTVAHTIRCTIGTGEDPPTAFAQSTTQNTVYAIGYTKYVRVKCVRKFTLNPDTSNPTQLQVICGHFGVDPNRLMYMAAQLEEVADGVTTPTAYERTSNVARGVRNLLLGSHFPTRAPWTTRSVAGSVSIDPEVGRGPEVRAIVPTPGAIEFGSSVTGVGIGTGLLRLIPKQDVYGHTACKYTTIATAGASLGQPVNVSPVGKTYIGSFWIRAGTQTPTNNWYINLGAGDGNNDYVNNKSIVFTPSMLTRAWRRIWVSWYIDSSVTGYASIEKMNLQLLALTTFTAGDNFEIFGAQLEEKSGNVPGPPADYVPTTSAASGVNLILWSSDFTNAAWGKSNFTVASGTGDAPIEYYTAALPDGGQSDNLLRINPGGIATIAADWSSGEGVFAHDDIAGTALSIGSYGTELVGTDGNFAWAAGVLTGWTITGGSQYFLPATGAVDAWTDDEESATPEGVEMVLENTAAPGRYMTKVITFAVGWHTIRLRTARSGVKDQNSPAIQLKLGSLYIDDSRVQLTSAVNWLGSNIRRQGAYAPDYGLNVWHVYIPTAGAYSVSIGGFAIGPSHMLVDQLRIWSDAGALYASADRTETAGNYGCLFQGNNVLFRGVVDDSIDADDSKISIRCRDYIHGTMQEIPSWTTQPNCQVKFRGTECGYVSTTTITVAEVSATSLHTVASTAKLQIGRYIFNSDGTGYTKISTIPSQTTFTTSEQQTYADGQAIIYSDCKRTYPDCDLRSRTHRYSGCRATQALQATAATQLYQLGKVISHNGSRRHRYAQGTGMIRATSAQLFGALSIEAQDSLAEKKIFDDTSIPLVYGRKSVKAIPVETHATKFSTDGSEWLTTFYVISMGELSDVRQFFSPAGPLIHNPAEGLSIYWHPGTQGVDDWWHLSDQFPGASPGCYTDPVALTQKVNNQKRDFRTNTDTAYNRIAYAVTQIKKGNALAKDLNDPTNVIDLWCDVKGIAVQVYDKYGVAVGSPSWSRNPVWIAVDGLTSRIIGPGLPFNAIDWAQMVISAAVCDTPIVSTVAVSQIRTVPVGASSDIWGMTSIDGFAPEMPVSLGYKGDGLPRTAWAPTTLYTANVSVVTNAGNLYYCIATGTSAASVGPTTTSQSITDGSGTPAVWRYVGALVNKIKYVDPINLRLFFESPFYAYVGQIIQGTPARYTCDLAITDKTDLATFVDMVLSSCRGFVAFDGGKLGIYIEKPATDTTNKVWALQTPTDTATMLGVIPGSVHYDQRRGSGTNYNLLEVTYECGQLLAGTNRVLKYADADRGGLDFPRTIKFEASGCDTADQAIRAMLPRFAKACSTAGADDTNQDVRGTTVKSGIALLPAAVGDFITLNRPSRTGSARSRIRSISIDPNYEITVETSPEARSIRPEGFSAPIDPYSDGPFIGTAMGSPLPLGTLTLIVTQSTGRQGRATVTVDGHAVGPGTPGGSELQIERFVRFELHMSAEDGFTPTTGSYYLGGTLVSVIPPTSSEFLFDIPITSWEQPLFLRAAGIIGGIDGIVVLSPQVPITIYIDDRLVSDPTQQEGSNTLNMVYGGDFEQTATPPWTESQTPPFPGIGAPGGLYVAPLSVLSPSSPAPTYPADPIPPGSETNTAFTYTGGSLLASIVDTNDNNYGLGSAQFDFSTLAVKTWPKAPSLTVYAFTEGTLGATHTCRPYIRMIDPGQPALNIGNCEFYYTLDVSVGSPVWVKFTPTGGPITTLATDLYGPILYNVMYKTSGGVAKFAIAVTVNASEVTLGYGGDWTPPIDNYYLLRVLRIGVEQQTVVSYGSVINDNRGLIFGDGATNYGSLSRPFPGKTPTGFQVAFTATTLNHLRLQIQKANPTDPINTIAANSHPVEVRVYDSSDPNNGWVLGSIPASGIDNSLQDFAVKFSPGSNVQGSSLRIEVRTLNTTPLFVDKLLVAQGDTIFSWVAAAQNHAEGYFGDFRLGWPRGFTKGRWSAGSVKKSPVS